jgi:hypothetical protein
MKSDRLAQEKQVVQTMISLYCRKQHHGKHLCASCSELLRYAHERIERCPEGVHKPFCSQCTIHCYEPKQRKQIRQVMRFSGPQMLFYHPVMALRHLISSCQKS